MSTQIKPPIAEIIETLRKSLAGRVITPDDAEYDRARQAFTGGIDRHPAVIARPANAEDVSRIVKLAAETGSELSVRSGGHSALGLSISDGGIMLDLTDLKEIDLDRDARTVWAGAGLTAIELSSKLAEDNLAVGFGDTGSVGIGGITLGGGVGYLSRKFGLTIDNLLAAEVVTADGEVRQVDAEREPDLFWAIRGGGGNFGVATRFKYRVSEVGQVVGGMLLLPATPQTVAGFVRLASEASDDLSTIANVMPAPPMPFVAPEHHGKLSIMALMVHSGDVEAGQAAMAPFRALATPIADMLRPMKYPEIYPPEDDSYHPLAIARTMFIDHVDEDVATTIVKWLNDSDAAMRVAQLRVLGGAISRVPEDATAYAHRASRIMVNIASFHEGADKPVREAWVNGFVKALQQGDSGAYVNFLAEDGPDRIRNAYPGATYERLQSIKRRYDPNNLFRLNNNIAPA